MKGCGKVFFKVTHFCCVHATHVSFSFIAVGGVSMPVWFPFSYCLICLIWTNPLIMLDCYRKIMIPDVQHFGLHFNAE